MADHSLSALFGSSAKLEAAQDGHAQHRCSLGIRVRGLGFMVQFRFQ